MATGETTIVGELMESVQTTGADLGGGFVGSERTPLLPDSFDILLPLLLPPDCPVNVTQSPNLLRAFRFNAHVVKQFF